MPRAERSEGVPIDRLTRLCDAMSSALEAHPEYREGIDKAIMLVDDEEQGGLVHHGYEEDEDMLVAQRLLESAQAIHEVNGMAFEVHVLPHRGQG